MEERRVVSTKREEEMEEKGEYLFSNLLLKELYSLISNVGAVVEDLSSHLDELAGGTVELLTKTLRV